MILSSAYQLVLAWNLIHLKVSITTRSTKLPLHPPFHLSWNRLELESSTNFCADFQSLASMVTFIYGQYSFTEGRKFWKDISTTLGQKHRKVFMYLAGFCQSYSHMCWLHRSEQSPNTHNIAYLQYHRLHHVHQEDISRISNIHPTPLFQTLQQSAIVYVLFL